MRFAESFDKLIAAFAVAEKSITLKFIDIKKYPIELTDGIGNEIVLMFLNGTFEVLPRNINGPDALRYIGPSIHRISHYAVMPHVLSSHNPGMFKPNIFPEKIRDAFVP